MKIFISQPMQGRTDEEISQERRAAIEDIKTVLKGKDFTIISAKVKEPKSGIRPLKYLAQSIDKLADADAIYFCRGWKHARGCKVEWACAMDYGIEIIKQ